MPPTQCALITLIGREKSRQKPFFQEAMPPEDKEHLAKETLSGYPGPDQVRYNYSSPSSKL